MSPHPERSLRSLSVSPRPLRLSFWVAVLGHIVVWQLLWTPPPPPPRESRTSPTALTVRHLAKTAPDTTEAPPPRPTHPEPDAPGPESERPPPPTAASLADARRPPLPTAPSRPSAPSEGYWPGKLLDQRPQPEEPVVIAFPGGFRSITRGRAVLRLYIGADGRVNEVELVESDAPLEFVDLARRSFLQAHFTPGMKDNVPVPSRIQIEVGFQEDRP